MIFLYYFSSFSFEKIFFFKCNCGILTDSKSRIRWMFFAV